MFFINRTQKFTPSSLLTEINDFPRKPKFISQSDKDWVGQDKSGWGCRGRSGALEERLRSSLTQLHALQIKDGYFEYSYKDKQLYITGEKKWRMK